MDAEQKAARPLSDSSEPDAATSTDNKSQLELGDDGKGALSHPQDSKVSVSGRGNVVLRRGLHSFFGGWHQQGGCCSEGCCSQDCCSPPAPAPPSVLVLNAPSAAPPPQQLAGIAAPAPAYAPAPGPPPVYIAVAKAVVNAPAAAPAPFPQQLAPSFTPAPMPLPPPTVIMVPSAAPVHHEEKCPYHPLVCAKLQLLSGCKSYRCL